MEQPDLAAVAEATSNRIRPCRQLQSDATQELGDDNERDIVVLASLDHRDPRLRKADRAPDRGLGQARSQPRLPELIEQLANKPITSTPAAISWRLPDCHDSIVARSA